MSDKDAGSIGKEINTPDMNTRKDAWQQLHDAKPADIKALAAEVTQKTDLHALGLDGFHLDEAKPATLLAVDATHNVQAFKFANGNKVVYMLPSGTEFDASATQLRNPDVPEAAKAPVPRGIARQMSERLGMIVLHLHEAGHVPDEVAMVLSGLPGAPGIDPLDSRILLHAFAGRCIGDRLVSGRQSSLVELHSRRIAV